MTKPWTLLLMQVNQRMFVASASPATSGRRSDRRRRSLILLAVKAEGEISSKG
jgi:hypothetical protein